ncbi:MAG: flagellar assembly protein FliH, partial [Schwartzia sp.]|nr:flagellar assembly protein FliH [Schwartzia sp. (in: firmicutes)]
EKILPQHFIDVPTVILPLVQKALLKVKDQPSVTVRVAPDSFDLVLMARSEMQNLLEGNAVLEVHSDENLGPGDVVLETPNGDVDARVSTQLESVRKAIQDVMS